MFTQIIKIAKILIAKGQAKKLLEYLIKDKYRDKQPTQQEIQIIKDKILKQIQPKSVNFHWFVHRFIVQNKHYQDIDNLLNLMQEYQKRKDNINFGFNDNSSFSDLTQLVQPYLDKGMKTQDFESPKYCKLIHSDGKYNYYYADAQDYGCYKDLHKCNTKKNGQQYAQWCVVEGNASWGDYTNSQFPFYVYVTDKNNEPIMLFNFGYDQDAQIKDIHDNAFTKYDQNLLSSIKQLAKKYNFDIQQNEDDFKTFNEVDKLYNKQINTDEIDQSIITESSKYNGLNFIQDNIIYDFKKHQKAYLIANNGIINLKSYKITLYLLNLLQDKKYNYVIFKLCDDDKFIKTCSKQVLNFIIDYLIDNNKCDNLYKLIYYDKIKDENQFKDAIQVLIDKNQFDYLYYLIYYDKIKDENQFKKAIQVLIDKNRQDALHNLINKDKIKDEIQLKEIIQKLIDKKWFKTLYCLILDDKIKDENQFKDAIQKLIDINKFGQLYGLIDNDKIKDENKVKEIIQKMIDNNWFGQLYGLIQDDKIKDKNQIKDAIQKLIDNNNFYWIYFLIEHDKIKDENQIKDAIQLLIDNNKFDDLYFLICQNKIKDENKVKEIIQVFIDNKQFDHLDNLITYDKIKDENQIKDAIQLLIDNNKFGYLYSLIEHNKIKDTELIKRIEDAKNNTNIKTSSISKKLYYISKIVKG